MAEVRVFFHVLLRQCHLQLLIVTKTDGTTNAGKSRILYGHTKTNNNGIIELAVEDLFRGSSDRLDRLFTVNMSIVEVYGEVKMNVDLHFGNCCMSCRSHTIFSLPVHVKAAEVSTIQYVWAPESRHSVHRCIL